MQRREVLTPRFLGSVIFLGVFKGFSEYGFCISIHFGLSIHFVWHWRIIYLPKISYLSSSDKIHCSYGSRSTSEKNILYSPQKNKCQQVDSACCVEVQAGRLTGVCVCVFHKQRDSCCPLFGGQNSWLSLEINTQADFRARELSGPTFAVTVLSPATNPSNVTGLTTGWGAEGKSAPSWFWKLSSDCWPSRGIQRGLQEWLRSPVWAMTGQQGCGPPLDARKVEEFSSGARALHPWHRFWAITSPHWQLGRMIWTQH